MYMPKHFHKEDRETLYVFIEQHSFGILVSNSQEGPFATHVPFLIDRERECLVTHMARANPHWQMTQHPVLVVFHGPHAYITPTWYEEEHNVPTWNYTAVHVYGSMRIVEDPARIRDVLTRTVDTYEANLPNPWKANFNDDFQDKLVGGLTAVEIPIERIEGKWKLSQNQSLLKRMRVIDRLRAQGDQGSLDVANLMESELHSAD